MSTPPAHSPLTGVLFLMPALALFASIDATAKHLAMTYPVLFLVWARYSVHLILMTVLLWPRFGRRLISTANPRLQVLRGLLLVICSSFGVAAFQAMPLGETTALIFITPLLVALLAGPLLKERMTPVKWLAIGVGFAGVLLIARPGGALAGIGIVYALACALCYAGYQVLTRQLSSSESSVSMLFYTALIGTLAMSLTLPFFWNTALPHGIAVAQIVSLGVFAGLGHYLLIRAFRHTPASTLAPFMYLQIVWATLLGGLVFGHHPDGWALVGMALIAASGLGLALHEQRRSTRDAKRH